MKRLITLITAICINFLLFSQSPQGFAYQAVVRDGAGEILSNQSIDFRLSIHENAIAGPVIYQETHSASTNQFGLANLTVGGGTPTSGVFQDIVWGNGTKFLEVEVNLTGTFESLGTTELLSVPFALYDGDWTISGSDMYTLNVGNVGIGTSNPSGKLDIRGAGIDDGALLYLGNSDRSHFIDLFPGREGDPNPFLRWKDSDPLRFATNAGPYGFTELMRITPEGNVGISTENPISKLGVGGDGMANVQIYSETNLNDGTVVYGHATATGDITNYGGQFRADGNYGFGIEGTGTGIQSVGGIFGSSGEEGIGVWGIASANTSSYNYGGNFVAHGEFGVGIVGSTFGNNGVGVSGTANAFGDVTNYGGTFRANGTTGIAIYGIAIPTDGTNYGASLEARGVNGRAVYGYAANSSGANYGGYFDAKGDSGTGVYAIASSNMSSAETYGGYFESNASNGRGVYAKTIGATGIAVSGIASYTGSGTNYGGYFEAKASSGRAVYGIASGNFGRAIMGVAGSPGSYAGYFSGNVNVTGTLSKGGGSFKIDHPLDPTNKNLYHSFVESPDMMNIYNGNVVTDNNGVAKVELPEWFEALNKDFRYQLTVIGEFAQAIVAEKIYNNQFVINTDKPNIEVSWQITGIRHDAFAIANRIPVEEMKRPEERGKYIHPEAFGQPKTAGVDYDEELEIIKLNMQKQRKKMDEERKIENTNLEIERNKLEEKYKVEMELLREKKQQLDDINKTGK
jgi:hypothetical protein